MKRALQNLFLTAATLICSTAATWAQTTFENEAGTLKFTVTDVTNRCVSVSQGSNRPTGNIVIPEKVTYPESNGVDYNVTSLGDYAFNSCWNMTSITIPSSVTSIGDAAFRNCSGLTSLSIPEGVANIGFEMFYYSYNLQSVTLPSTVTSIGDYAFAYCSRLATISIPEGVTSIGNYAFSECSSLTSISIPGTVTTIGAAAFQSCSKMTGMDMQSSNYTYDNGVLFNKDKTTILCYLAGKAETTYSVPNTVTTIGDYAFGGCKSLVSVTMSNSVTSIGSYAFSYCSNLETISISELVTSMGDNAFSGCNKLQYTEDNGARYLGNTVNPHLFLRGVISTDITTCEINSNCKFIGTYALSNCRSLTSITIPEGVLGICSQAFQESYNMRTINIPASVTRIGTQAFFATGLAEMNLAEGNTAYTVENHVLYNKDKTILVFCCPYGLSGSYVIPETVTKIESGAFMMCDLTTLTIPEGIEEFGSAFYTFGCKLIIMPASVTGISEKIFAPEACVTVTAVSYSGNDPKAPWGAPYLNPIIDGDFVYADETKTNLIAYLGADSDVNIPNTVTSIGESAFTSCASITSVTIPNSVTSIGASAFSNCKNLAVVTIPSTVMNIGNYAFNSSDNVTLYCEIEESAKPSGWSQYWNQVSWTPAYCPVEWGCKVVRVVVDGDSEIGKVAIGGENYAVKGNDGSMWYLAATTNGTDTLTASPAAHFVKWNDNSTDNPRIVNVTASETYTATFSAHSDSVVFENVVAATCTTAGSYDSVVYCSICKIELSRDSISVSATGHKADSVLFENIMSSTCTESGSYDSVVYCSVCHVEVSRTHITTPANGHTVVVDSAVVATATTDGLTEGSHCSVCGVTIVPQEVIPATGEQGGNENQGGGNTEPATAVAESAANAVSIYSFESTIVVEAEADGNEITVFDINGRMVAKSLATSNRAEIQMPKAGIYIVRIGNTAERVAIK